MRMDRSIGLSWNNVVPRWIQLGKIIRRDNYLPVGLQQLQSIFASGDEMKYVPKTAIGLQKICAGAVTGPQYLSNGAMRNRADDKLVAIDSGYPDGIRLTVEDRMI